MATYEPSNDRAIDRELDRFFSGAMPEGERAAFLARVAGDPELADLLGAERLIQLHEQQSIGRLATADFVVPNAAILDHLRRTRSRRMWPMYIMTGLFGLLLFSAVCLTGSYHRTAVMSPRGTSPAAIDTTSKRRTEQPITTQQEASEPVAHPQASPSAAPNQVGPTVTQAPLRLDEPKGMRVYSNDTLRVNLHSK